MKFTKWKWSLHVKSLECAIVSRLSIVSSAATENDDRRCLLSSLRLGCCMNPHRQAFRGPQWAPFADRGSGDTLKWPPWPSLPGLSVLSGLSGPRSQGKYIYISQRHYDLPRLSEFSATVAVQSDAIQLISDWEANCFSAEGSSNSLCDMSQSWSRHFHLGLLQFLSQPSNIVKQYVLGDSAFVTLDRSHGTTGCLTNLWTMGAQRWLPLARSVSSAVALVQDKCSKTISYPPSMAEIEGHNFPRKCVFLLTHSTVPAVWHTFLSESSNEHLKIWRVLDTSGFWLNPKAHVNDISATTILKAQASGVLPALSGLTIYVEVVKIHFCLQGLSQLGQLPLLQHMLKLLTPVQDSLKLRSSLSQDDHLDPCSGGGPGSATKSKRGRMQTVIPRYYEQDCGSTFKHLIDARFTVIQGSIDQRLCLMSTHVAISHSTCAL